MSTMHRLFFLLIFSSVTSARDYLFPGCEMKNVSILKTTKDILHVYAVNGGNTSPLQVRVIEPGKIFESVRVELPVWTWTRLPIDLKNKVIISPYENLSFPLAEDSQGDRNLTENPTERTVLLWDADSMVDCPQGLPYKILDRPRTSFVFPYLTETKAEQTYLLFALSQVKVGYRICSLKTCHNGNWQGKRLCYDEDKEQLKKVEGDDDACPDIPAFRYFKVKFTIKMEQVKGIDKNDLVEFTLEGNQQDYNGGGKKLILIQCFHSECESLQKEETNDLPQNGNAPDYFIGFIVMLLLSLVFGIAIIILYFWNRNQINQLRAENARLMPTAKATYQNTAAASVSPGVNVMTENDIYVSYDQLQKYP